MPGYRPPPVGPLVIFIIPHRRIPQLLRKLIDIVQTLDGLPVFILLLVEQPDVLLAGVEAEAADGLAVVVV